QRRFVDLRLAAKADRNEIRRIGPCVTRIDFRRRFGGAGRRTADAALGTEVWACDIDSEIRGSFRIGRNSCLGILAGRALVEGTGGDRNDRPAPPKTGRKEQRSLSESA